jgi:AAA+ ATPase superfamily predicted ATPase
MTFMSAHATLQNSRPSFVRLTKSTNVILVRSKSPSIRLTKSAFVILVRRKMWYTRLTKSTNVILVRREVTVMMKFYGRFDELERLESAQQLPGAKLFVVTGRRRIGKSTLIEKFGEHHKFYRFMGLPPTRKSTSQDQRDEFARLLSEQLGLPEFETKDWGKMFSLLGREVLKGEVVILFDEISWMADRDDQFLPKLKSAWDLYFSKNPKLTLVLCGSVSSWIRRNIMNSTGYLGRPTLEITLEELPLNICVNFWGKHPERISAYEKFKILSLTGGVPRYLGLIDPKKTAEDNILNLCFIKDSILSNEFNRIFSDIFGKRSKIYLKIIGTLVNGHHSLDEILLAIGREKGGDISDYMSDLQLAGFIKRDHTWEIKTGMPAKLSRYRLSDNYLRFYLKYVQPNKAKIEKNLFKNRSISNLPGWESIMGLQFENMVINNEHLLFKKLGIPIEDIVFANPYYQTQTQRRKGCQIDYLLQTRYNNVYVFEIKFSKNKIGTEVIEEVQEKINRLKLPRNFSYRPILIHINGVTSDLENSEYFSKIINYSDFLITTHNNGTANN